MEIISHCAWLYHRFPLSLREVEEMMMARGVIVSYETIQAWCHKFGQTYANGLRRRRPRPGDKWHLDEVFIKIQGMTLHLPKMSFAQVRSTLVLVENAAVAIASSYVEAVQLVRIGDLRGQRV